jgi:hypothetical protein
MNGDAWVTVAEAAHATGKSRETIRRWRRTYPESLRTKIIGDITHMHAGDLAALASGLPHPNPERQACTREGHQPVGDRDAWEHGTLTTVLGASDIVKRSKTAIIRWAQNGDVRALKCRCGGRTYIYAADLEPARKRYDRNRKRPER